MNKRLPAFLLLPILLILLTAGTPSTVFNSALEKSKSGDFRSAISLYNEAIRQEPDVNYYYYHRANARYKVSDLSGAIEDLNESLMLEETFDAYYLRGLCLTLSHRHDQALADLNSAVNMRPDNKNTHFYIGVNYYFLKNYDDAVTALDKALFYDKFYYDAFLYRGLAKFNKGDAKQGIKDLLQCLGVKGDYPVAMFELSKMYWAVEDKDQCLSFLDMAIELDPNLNDAIAFRAKNFPAQ